MVPDNQVVATQRAAGLLGMSRPFFIELLETGAMAHHVRPLLTVSPGKHWSGLLRAWPDADR
jgi:hypothetical protein